jgi:hypothetical protein
MRIFDLLDKRQELSLQQATAYECGIAVLTWHAWTMLELFIKIILLTILKTE